MLMLLLKALGWWVPMVGIGIANGILREKLLSSAIGQAAALPASGALLALLVFLYTLLVAPALGADSAPAFWAVGGLWALMTVAFEFVFGHVVMGRPWSDLLRVLLLHKGDLMLIVLIVTLTAPYLAARLRGLV